MYSTPDYSFYHATAAWPDSGTPQGRGGRGHGQHSNVLMFQQVFTTPFSFEIVFESAGDDTRGAVSGDSDVDDDVNDDMDVGARNGKDASVKDASLSWLPQAPTDSNTGKVNGNGNINGDDNENINDSGNGNAENGDAYAASAALRSAAFRTDRAAALARAFHARFNAWFDAVSLSTNATAVSGATSATSATAASSSSLSSAASLSSSSAPSAAATAAPPIAAASSSGTAGNNSNNSDNSGDDDGDLDFAVTTPMRKMAKAILSNMLGGAGYFFGRGFQQASGTCGFGMGEMAIIAQLFECPFKFYFSQQKISIFGRE